MGWFVTRNAESISSYRLKMYTKTMVHCSTHMRFLAVYCFCFGYSFQLPLFSVSVTHTHTHILKCKWWNVSAVFRRPFISLIATMPSIPGYTSIDLAHIHFSLLFVEKMRFSIFFSWYSLILLKFSYILTSVYVCVCVHFTFYYFCRSEYNHFIWKNVHVIFDWFCCAITVTWPWFFFKSAEKQ